MTDLPLGLALTAGLVAAFNPCGFALLPAYLATLLATDEDAPRGGLLRAVRLALAMTAGFVTVFGVFGLIVTPLALSVEQHLPWATVVIGVAITGLGVWLLSGRELLLRIPHLPAGRGGSLYVYGVSYAVASLSCTIGPFLAVISTSLTAEGALGSFAMFVAYAIGMGLVVTLLSIVVALARSAAVSNLRRAMPYISRISGSLLVLAGLYVAYYGWYELRVFAGGDAADPVVGAATAVQGAIAGWLERLGPGLVALALAVLVAVVVVVGKWRRASRVGNPKV